MTEKEKLKLADGLKEEGEKEKLSIMEAKAGHEMIETIYRDDNQPMKIVYMTNEQAAAVAKDEKALNLMKEELCGKEERSLIIDLVHSWGFTKSTQLMDKVQFEHKFCAGIKYNTPPFENFDDEARTLDQLDHFMKTVLIPLAEDTRAIVICNPILGDCALSDSFAKTVEQNSAIWGGDPPFAMVGAYSQVDVLYCNNNPNVSWRKIMKKCKRWKYRHNLFLEEYFSEKDMKGPDWRGHDINYDHKRLLIVEGLNMDELRKNNNPKNRAAFSSLMTALIREIGHNASSLAIKTGATGRDGLAIKIPKGIDPMSLRMLVERANENAKVLCLDIRKRDNIQFDIKKILKKNSAGENSAASGQHSDNDKLLDCIKEKIRNRCKLEYESLDISALAYLKDLLSVLTEEISAHNLQVKKEGKQNSTKKDFESDTLRCKIREYEVDAEEDMVGGAKEGAKGSNEDMWDDIDFGKYAHMFAKEFYRNILHKSKENTFYKKYQTTLIGEDFGTDGLEASKEIAPETELEGIFGNEIMHTANLVRQLLMNPRFYSANIWEPGIKNLIYNDIVLSRKTSEAATYQGLIVLRDALDNADTTHLAADWYKHFSKRLYVFQLILGFFVTVFSVTGANWTNNEFEKLVIKRATLVCSLLLAGLVSIDTLFTPRLNWRQLRQYAVELDSTIWKFRMRVDEFEVDDNNRNRGLPENNLKDSLYDWKTRLKKNVSSIALTRFTGKMNIDIKRKQFRSFTLNKIEDDDGEKVGVDNNFSTLTGQEYMNYRVGVLIRLYQSKTFKNELFQYFPQVIVILLGVIIAFVSELDQLAVVSLLIALTTSIQLWIEFAGTLDRGPLYSDAISACELEETKWRGLDNFTKQNKDTRRNLVKETEKIVMGVISSWSSTLQNKESTTPKARTENQLLQDKLPKEITPKLKERNGTPTGLDAV